MVIKVFETLRKNHKNSCWWRDLRGLLLYRTLDCDPLLHNVIKASRSSKVSVGRWNHLSSKTIHSLMVEQLILFFFFGTDCTSEIFLHCRSYLSCSMYVFNKPWQKGKQKIYTTVKCAFVFTFHCNTKNTHVKKQIWQLSRQRTQQFTSRVCRPLTLLRTVCPKLASRVIWRCEVVWR